MPRRRTTEHVRIYSPQEIISLPICHSGNSGAEVQKILTERKCWRIAKDSKYGVVWPPELEAALIEGLEKYTPRESRSARSFGRFPNRNKIVARHILKVTGKYRTPKQIGSRIQQLKDSDTGKILLQKLSNRHYEMMHRGHRNAADGSMDELDPHPSLPTHSPLSNSRFAQVTIEVLPGDVSWSYPGHPACQPMLNPSSQLEGVFHYQPRPLSAIDPTVTFTSPSILSAYSSFRVFQGEILVHAEDTPFEPQSSIHHQGINMMAYSTVLVPQFWNTLCASADPASYTILQDIVSISDPWIAPGDSDILLSVFYLFSQGLSLNSAMNESYASTSNSQSSTPQGSQMFSDISPLYTPESGVNNAAGYFEQLEDCDSVVLSSHHYTTGYGALGEMNFLGSAPGIQEDIQMSPGIFLSSDSNVSCVRTQVRC